MRCCCDLDDLDAPSRACAASRPAVPPTRPPAPAFSEAESCFFFPPKSEPKKPDSFSFSSRASRSRSLAAAAFFLDVLSLPPHFPKIPFLSLSLRGLGEVERKEGGEVERGGRWWWWLKFSEDWVGELVSEGEGVREGGWFD